VNTNSTSLIAVELELSKSIDAEFERSILTDKKEHGGKSLTKEVSNFPELENERMTIQIRKVHYNHAQYPISVMIIF